MTFAATLNRLRSNDPALISLTLNGKEYDAADGKALAEVLKINCMLQSLDLFWNHLGDEGVKALAEALKFNRALQSLNLNENRFGDEGAKALAEALKVNSTLQELNLGVNH